MKRYYLFLLFLFPFFLNAQVIIQGSIKDLATNEPLIGAFITLKGTTYVGVSDTKGSYYVITPTPKEPQKYILVISHIGYRDKFEVVDILPVDDGETIFKDFTLESDPLTLKDVTVTANKVEEELQDVPIAATVLDANNLEKRTVSNTEEAFQSVPNLITDAYLPSQSTFSLRGLASDFSNIGVENSVGLYIDDVFYSRSFNFNQTLMDIERVEVLRGPQGTLFGKNTVGGVLHIITEKPKFSNFGAIELNAGNFQYLQARAKANVQLVPDKVAMRVSGAFRKRDGWLLERNKALADQNGTLFYGGRLSLLAKPNDNIKIFLSSHFTADPKADFTVEYKVPDSGINPLAVIPEETNYLNREAFQNEEGLSFDRKSYGFTGHVDIQLSKVHKLSSISAYNRTNSSFLRDFDETSVNALIFGQHSSIETISQELRISTPRKDRKLFYIAGVYLLKEKITNQDTFAAKEGMAPVWEALYASVGMPIDLPDTYFETSKNNSVINSGSYAAYLGGSYEVTPNIRINAGVRYTHETKDIEYWQRCVECTPLLPPESPLSGSPMSDFAAPAIASPNDPIRKDTINRVITYNFGMDFKTTDHTLLYINYARGFKASGFNVNVSPSKDFERAALLFKPEFIYSYEVGLKLRANNRYQFNAAAFVTDFQNKQEIVGAGNRISVENANAVQGQGLEVEFTGIWNRFFRTEIALGALNLKYRDFSFDDPNDPLPPFDQINLSGNRAFKAPDLTFKFAPEIHSNIGRELKLLARGDLNYVGRVYNDIFNTKSLSRAPSTVINARVQISTRNERFSLALWGKNLTNTTYIQHAWSFVFGDHVAVNPPRMVGVELRTNFY
ncbi:MAG: TonB-dependent receptor [Bacteroidetes bacterium]|nr:MAG: TonB-dependent receptor [Bacteroidota bacterium]